MKSALLVVDMQNGFCHPEGSFARIGMGLEGAEAAVRHAAVAVGQARHHPQHHAQAGRPQPRRHASRHQPQRPPPGPGGQPAGRQPGPWRHAHGPFLLRRRDH
jgi:nicotinamidase-related amidase